MRKMAQKFSPQGALDRINRMIELLKTEEGEWFEKLPPEKQFDQACRVIQMQKNTMQEFKIMFTDMIPIIFSILAMLLALLK